MITLAFSPDGKQLAIGDMLSVKLINVQSGKLQHRLPAPFRMGRSRFVYSPDGRLLARVATDNIIRIWDTKTGNELMTLPTECHDASFSSDGKWLAVARSHKTDGIAVWKLRD